MRTLKEMLAEARQAVPEEGPADLQRRLKAGEKVAVIDVRDPDEFRDGHIEGSANISRGFLEFRIGTAVTDPAMPIVLYCQTGLRSVLGEKFDYRVTLEAPPLETPADTPLFKLMAETLTAHDGDQALELLESHPEIELLITDIMMPKTNGVELVRKIKQRYEWNELPILVCTSLKPTSINNAIPMQGWKYLFKPIKADSLIRMVKEAVSQQRAVLQNPDQTMA